MTKKTNIRMLKFDFLGKNPAFYFGILKRRTIILLHSQAGLRVLSYLYLFIGYKLNCEVKRCQREVGVVNFTSASLTTFDYFRTILAAESAFSFKIFDLRWSLYFRIPPCHFVTVPFSHIHISSATWN